MDESRDTILEFRNVTVAFGNRVILQNINFKILRGEFCYLIGKTGAGKSSMLRLIYADLIPTEGEVFIDGISTSSLKRRQIPYLRRKLGIVFQDFQLLPEKNVFENIRFAMRATGWSDKQKIRNRASELLVKTGLSSRENSMPWQLSGGEQQRVSISRALVNDPLIILADEPTGNLDPESTENIMDILAKINLGGTSILMATHEYGLINKFPARVLEVKAGELIDHPLGHVV